MFRDFILIGISFLSIFSVSLSAVNYGMAGCGLGSMIPAWKNDISQVIAATTNGSSSNQTFGITSGTSNCTNDGIVKAEKAQEVFVHYNQAGLESEMAAGRGERLDAFAQLLGCPTHSQQLGNLVKKNYSKILTTDTRKDSKLLLASLKKEIGSDLELSEACQF
ncbi:DUF3015 domain-containing protein [Leptospira ilyithenensis]|nr:DUF3015 domain-containing protein [Leptospira ilyithenensis]